MLDKDFEILLNKIKSHKVVFDKVEKLGGFTQKITQSDKLGYDWIEDYLGEKLVAQTYSKQEKPVGVADNPFIFEIGVKLIPNAYYIYNDERYVYTGTEVSTATVWDESNFEKF